MFASLFHAFMCSRIRFRRSAGASSRKPTVSFTPADPQYDVVITAIRCGVARNPRIKPANWSIRGWFTGLILVAVRAASTSMLLGNLFSLQQINSFFFMHILHEIPRSLDFNNNRVLAALQVLRVL